MPQQQGKHHLLRFLWTVLCLCGHPFHGGAAYKRINRASPDDPLQVAIYRLDNGLTVYLSENHQKPNFYAEIVVRAGSKHDPADSTGLAHYLEHLLFKGTSRIGTLDHRKEKPHLDRIRALYEKRFRTSDPQEREAIYAEINKESQLAAQYAIPNEIDKLYKSMGAKMLNAHTWHEETVYKVMLPANRLRQWAAVESERFREPVFRLFQPELEIVYEEKNRALDKKDRILHDALQDILFPKHPYGQQPTLGTTAHLKNPSLENIHRFYQTWYIPNNMAICISGDIETANAISVIDEYFSIWRPGTLQQFSPPGEAPIRERRHTVVQYPGEEMVMLAFRTIPRGHPDEPAVTLLDMILSNATAGLIDLHINQAQKARNAGAYRQIYNDYGAEIFSAVAKKGQSLEEVEQLLLAEISKVKQGRFEDWILPAVITDFKIAQKKSLENNPARVARMRSSFLAFETWDRSIHAIDRMEHVTRKDVIRAANRYFSAGYAAAYRRDGEADIPSMTKPSMDKVDIDPERESAFSRRVRAMPTKSIEPVYIQAKDFKVMEYAPGVRLYYVRNPLNDLFSLRISVEKGTRHDKRLDIAAALMDKTSTSRHTPEALKKQWYKLGSNVGIWAGENESGVTLSGLDENFDASLSLLMEMLQDPKAEEDALQQLVRIRIAQREDAKKNPGTLLSALVHYSRFRGDSPYLARISSEAMRALKTDELHALIHDLLQHEHTITYTGSLSLDDLLRVLRRHHRVAGGLKQAPPHHFLRVRETSGRDNEVRFVHHEMTQAQIQFDFGCGDFDAATVVPASLYNDYFSGGMSGIVFQELREARALAYVAGARYVPGDRLKAQNRMSCYIACQADKTMEAMDAFLDLLDNMPRTPARFQETIASLNNHYRTSRIGFRRLAQTLIAWKRQGFDADPRKAWFARIQKADPGLMWDFYARQIQNRPKLISVVGDKNRIDVTRLEKFGALTEVRLQDLFTD